MKAKKVFDNTTRSRAVGFLVWFRNQYGQQTQDTYCGMAKKYGQCNYGTCRNMVIELIKAGYLYIRDNGLNKRYIVIKREKYNELVNPYIFQKED